MSSITRTLSRRRTALVLPLLLPSLALAACGSSGNGGATTKNASATLPAGVAQARALVDAASKTPKFFAPPAFATTKARGKTVWYVGDQSSNIIQEWTSGAKQALASQGVKLRVYDPGSASAEHIKGIQLAIANRAAAIILGDGWSPVVFSAQVAQAKKAGIPFFSLVSGTPKFQPKVPGLALDVSYDYVAVGRLLADWFIADSNGKGDALLIESPDIPSSTFELNGFREEVAKLAPGAKVTTKKFNATTAPNLGQDLVANIARTGILADPKLGYIIPAFDSQALYAQTGVQQAGAGQRVKTAGFNSIVPQMQNLKKGNTPFRMDVGGVNVWLAYALADNVLRAIVGQPLVRDPHVGVRVFTHDNVQNLNVNAEDDAAWYEVDYPSLYTTKVWTKK
ncbi:MAG: ABC-type sugar transport system periplasmic component-like protein [Solirubrobacterales bacterium]|jgi:ribose transport system substrate-binding protein|nr:ABC-type sugar transport system periplasmic component-like protein [Solirubrobacterales bacterium]